MIDTAKHERKLQQDVANTLNVSPESLDPTHETLRQTIERKAHDLARITEHTVEGSTYINRARLNPSNIREGKLRKLKRAA